MRKTFDGASEIQIITDKEIRELRELYGVNINESWKQFHRKYGESSWLVSLSRIGYNAGHTEAIVQCDMGYGPLAGEGLMIVLKKENGAWQVVDVRMLWIA